VAGGYDPQLWPHLGDLGHAIGSRVE
jgi:hypothetical protein